MLGFSATTVGVLFLLTFFWTLIAEGNSAFVQSFVELDVEFSADVLAPATPSASFSNPDVARSLCFKGSFRSAILGPLV